MNPAVANHPKFKDFHLHVRSVLSLDVVILSLEGDAIPLRFRYEKLVLAGWSGRDRGEVMAHIEELSRIGVPSPTEVPKFFSVGPNLLTTSRRIGVLEGRNSGEVEYVVLVEDGKPRYVTVGSDHTDREVERMDVHLSKQLYPKIIPPVVWPYEEVEDHWDELVLELRVDGEVAQRSDVGKLLGPEDLIERAGLDGNAVLFSGSIPWIGGRMRFGGEYRMEIGDPLLGRMIAYSYSIYRV